MERKQFTFYDFYYYELIKLPKKQFLRAFDMVCDYALSGIIPDLRNEPKSLVSSINKLMPSLETERRLSIEGRRSTEYKEWRRSVFERDNYTCQMCHERGVKLNAHHIYSYAFFPDLRYTTSNGITLCTECHKRVHGTGGHT